MKNELLMVTDMGPGLVENFKLYIDNEFTPKDADFFYARDAIKELLAGTPVYYQTPKIKDMWKYIDHDFSTMSLKYPGVLFTLLFKQGELPVAVWYFSGGKKQEALPRIEFEEFDPKKLQEI